MHNSARMTFSIKLCLPSVSWTLRFALHSSRMCAVIPGLFWFVDRFYADEGSAKIRTPALWQKRNVTFIIKKRIKSNVPCVLSFDARLFSADFGPDEALTLSTSTNKKDIDDQKNTHGGVSTYRQLQGATREGLQFLLEGELF